MLTSKITCKKNFVKETLFLPTFSDDFKFLWDFFWWSFQHFLIVADWKRVLLWFCNITLHHSWHFFFKKKAQGGIFSWDLIEAWKAESLQVTQNTIALWKAGLACILFSLLVNMLSTRNLYPSPEYFTRFFIRFH